jgi:hypothetical protein
MKAPSAGVEAGDLAEMVRRSRQVAHLEADRRQTVVDIRRVGLQFQRFW